MQPLERLIHKIANQTSTEELILFIANDKGIVSACLDLQQKLERGERQELIEIEELCRKNQFSLEVLSTEIRNILAIFSPGSVRDEYSILGLERGAGLDEIKKAFRRLSRQYHPDAAGGGDSKKFMEICRAYKSLTGNAASSVQVGSPKRTKWKYKKKQGPSRAQKRRNITIVTGLVGILLLISLLSPLLYRKRVMMKHLNTADSTLVTKSVSDGKIQQKAEISPDIKDEDTQQSSPVPQAQTSTVPEQTFLPQPVPSTAARMEEENPAAKESPSAEPTIAAPQPPLSPVDTTRKLPSRETKVQAPSPVVATTSDRQTAHHQETNKAPEKIRPKKNIADNKPAAIQPIARQELRNKSAVSLPTTATQSSQPEKKHHVARQAKHKITTAPKPTPGPEVPSPAEMNKFLNAYVTAYTSKNYQRFSRFFTPDALENGSPFISLHEEYIHLFQTLENVTLKIDILALSLKRELVQLRGRFKISLKYPHQQPINKKGKISFLLVKSNRYYLVKELSYAFDDPK